MPNKFETHFTAVDKATPVAEKVDSAFERMTKRTQQLEARLKALDERGKKSSLESPLEKFSKGSKIAAENVAQILPPFRMLTSVGSIAGIGMLARGMADLAMNAGMAAINIQRASKYSNTNSQSFQELVAAGELKHLPEGAVESALQRLYQQGEAGRLNFDQEARALYLTKVKPGAKGYPMRNGSIDTEQLLYDFSNFIATTKLAPDQQRRVLEKHGLADIRPLLEGGPGALNRLRAQARGNGAVIDEQGLKDREDLANGLSDVKQKVKGFGSNQYSGVLRGRQGYYDGTAGSAFFSGGRLLFDSFLFPDAGYDPNGPSGPITTPALISQVQSLSARLSRYGQSGINTLSEIAAAEGFADPSAAAAGMSKSFMNLGTENELNLNDAGTQSYLISALRKERGEYAPEPGQLVEAVRQAISNTTVKVEIDVNGPARVRATDGNGNPVPARVNTTSPTAVGQ